MLPKRVLVSNINSQVGRSQILPVQVLSQHASLLSFQSYPQEERMFLFSFHRVVKPFAPRKKQSKGIYPDETV